MSWMTQDGVRTCPQTIDAGTADVSRGRKMADWFLTAWYPADRGIFVSGARNAGPDGLVEIPRSAAYGDTLVVLTDSGAGGYTVRFGPVVGEPRENGFVAVLRPTAKSWELVACGRYANAVCGGLNPPLLTEYTDR